MPHPTGLAVAVLAQEEFAKSFLLQLVSDGALPWVPAVRRALTNHECSHLVSIIMEWLHRTSEEHIERVVSRLPDAPLEGVPDEVAFAINILRHEKMERLTQGYAFKEAEWDGMARRLADGLRERSKQRALYISVEWSGRLTPLLI
ncbi:MAG: hypothetical protein HYY48_05335 [Gammaproteobacteria bacterium]|nr:hypothetical protein [Gammaproteobacteria bacterium]